MCSIFKLDPKRNKHSWTITSRLGDMLKNAEKNFGLRDNSYTILGIELTQTDVDVPHILNIPDGKQIIIRITMNCNNDLNRAVYQVAHESIHCLAPTGTTYSNVLEEGLATFFSLQYTRDNGHGSTWIATPKYNNACKSVEQLLAIDPDIIKKMRLVQPTISFIDKNLILETNNSVPVELADDLTKEF